MQADFAQLPYVATAIRQARFNSDPTAPPQPTLLLDLGGAWSAESWVCQATDNRAPYLLLDAMGYALCRADGLDVGGILGMRDVVQMGMIDDSVVHRWHSHGVEVQVGAPATAPAITWHRPPQPATATTFFAQNDGTITLYQPTGFLGKIVAEYPAMTIISAERLPLTTNRPDPSITEMVKFVEREASAYQERQRQKGDKPT